MDSLKNVLLNQLEGLDWALLAPVLREVTFAQGEKVMTSGQPIASVHFIESGVLSLMAGERGRQTEVGMVGAEGLIGLPLLLGGNVAVFDAVAQTGPVSARSASASDILDCMKKSFALTELLLRYGHCMAVQVASTVVAQASFSIEARLARWLLMCHDRIEDTKIPVTHDELARMVCARREGVTRGLHHLEGSGMIRSTRGMVTVLDRAKMVELAHPSYGGFESEYSRVIAPFGKHLGSASHYSLPQLRAASR